MFPTGSEYLIKKMKPVKWAAIRYHLTGNSPMPGVNDQPARITAPESYMYYDDLCTVLYLVGFGPQGLYNPRDVAVSMDHY